MTQFVTIDRATLEQLVAALEMPCDRWSTVQFEIAADAIKAGRAALANAEPIGWQAIETAPATANNVLAFRESGSMKIKTGFWLLNMLHAANVDGEKCNYTHWMPLPSRPGATL